MLRNRILLKIPMGIRYGVCGFLANVIFMVAYNVSIEKLEDQMAASTIYSITYFFFIPANHFLLNILVFGWPRKYVSSLLSNYPIGLSAIMIGAACTAYLDKVGFELFADDFVRSNITHELRKGDDDHEQSGEFYSSLVVLFITGIWSYVLSVIINAPAPKPGKKEL